MSKQNSRVVRGIVSFIGIDYSLLKKSGEDNIAKFYLTGFFVILIFCLSFFSVFYGFDLMFHMWYAEVLLASFFSLTFLTIYLLLIQTFSKETLPTTDKNTFFTTSNITRICFVLLISFIIAQPIKIFVLRDILDSDIVNYKNGLYNEFALKNTKLYQKDLDKLKLQKAWFEKLSHDNSSKLLLSETDEKISKITNHIKLDNSDALIKITNSDFFLKRIELASKYSESWFICLCIIIIFSIPVYLIYSISDDSKYYSEKKKNDHDLVLREYEQFKEQYNLIFKNKYNKDIHFCELFDDPPFNKTKKPEPSYLDHNEFYKNFVEQ